MIFKIFKKTGEYKDLNGDWDGDEGYEVEIEVPDEEVNKALPQIIYDCYFKASTPYIEHSYEIIATKIKKNIARLISDCNLEEKMRECFADELNEWAQEEYDND